MTQPKTRSGAVEPTKTAFPLRAFPAFDRLRRLGEFAEADHVSMVALREGVFFTSCLTWPWSDIAERDPNGIVCVPAALIPNIVAELATGQVQVFESMVRDGKPELLRESRRVRQLADVKADVLVPILHDSALPAPHPLAGYLSVKWHQEREIRREVVTLAVSTAAKLTPFVRQSALMRAMSSHEVIDGPDLEPMEVMLARKVVEQLIICMAPVAPDAARSMFAVLESLMTGVWTSRARDVARHMHFAMVCGTEPLARNDPRRLSLRTSRLGIDLPKPTRVKLRSWLEREDLGSSSRGVRSKRAPA